jgi:outer membrane protease
VGRAVPVSKYLLRLLAVACIIATPAFAADQALPPLTPPLVTKAEPIPDVEYFVPNPAPAWQAEFAARYWFAEAKTGKTLYGAPSLYDGAVSRLTYRDLLANSGELYGRLAATNGLFIKGYAGVGALLKGSLQDEDFATPSFSPYSSTTSDQRNGFLSYGTLDLGYDVVRGGDFNLGALVGYTIFKESMTAYGCTQTAANPNVCQPAIPNATKVITQTNIWQSPRLGANGSVTLGRFTLNADAAWLPYVKLNGTDSHWLRIGTATGDFSGPIPEDGTGMGYQLEALLSYAITSNASVGVGARYWHMQTNGNSHFENLVVNEGGLPQPVSWKTDIFGAFIQGSYKFGPYPFAGMF